MTIYMYMLDRRCDVQTVLNMSSCVFRYFQQPKKIKNVRHFNVIVEPLGVYPLGLRKLSLINRRKRNYTDWITMGDN